METTVGKILLKAHLPVDMHPFIDSNELDKKGLSTLFTTLAEKHPDKYNKVVSEMARMGFETSTRMGSTVRLSDLKSPIDKKQRFDELEEKLNEIRKTVKDPKKYQEEANKIYQKFAKDIDKELVEVGVAKGQTLAKIIKSGSRGSPAQYRQTIFSPILVQDAAGVPLVDFPIKKSFAEGLNLPEYLSTTFGSREGSISTKLAVADAGAFCLAANTKVLMADNTVKRIDQITAGEYVTGADKNGNTFPVKVLTLFYRGLREVTEYVLTPDLDDNCLGMFEELPDDLDDPIYDLLADSCVYLSLNATPEHKILYISPTGEHVVEPISTLGKCKAIMAGGKTATYFITEDTSTEHTYDLEVDHPDHLFVLDGGLIVSNSKQLTRATMTIRVEEHDCGTNNGVQEPVSDKDSIGAFLAKPVGGYNKNNEITPKVLSDLHNKGIKSIIVRSPVTCQSSQHFHHGAVCQLCAGKREKGLPSLGDFLGISSVSGMGESLSQGTLNKKHSAGSAAAGPSISSGLDLIKQLASIPQHFKDKAAIAEHDGIITSIQKAAQGGLYLHVNSEEYYLPEGFEPTVKIGDHVEAGDVLSQGIPNPADIVRLKGIGEGRLYFTHAMKKAFDEGGMGGINRRNFETLSKALIDHVRITDNNGLGDHLPNEVVAYQSLEKDYQPRADSAKVRVDMAYDKYLETPVLHYTIGTRITKKIIENLKSNHVESVVVSDKPPGFVPEMQRIDAIPTHEHDWMHQLYSTNLERKLIHAVNTGAYSDLKGPSPIPGLAYGVGFGEK